LVTNDLRKGVSFQKKMFVGVSTPWGPWTDK
jgi:hypothetical protein